MLKRLVTILLLFSINHAIAEQRESGWYVGFQLGESDSSYKNSDINSIINVSGITIPPTTTIKQSVKTNGWAWRPYFGYQLNPFFGLELGFAKYASVQFDNIYGIPGYNAGLDPRTTDFVAKVMFPISNFNIYGKLGAAYLQQGFSFDTKSIHPSLIV